MHLAISCVLLWVYFLLQIDEQIESMFNSKKRVKDLSAPGGGGGGGGGGTAGATAAAGLLAGIAMPSAGNIQKLELAKKLAIKINAQKNLGAEAQVTPCCGTKAIKDA